MDVINFGYGNKMLFIATIMGIYFGKNLMTIGDEFLGF